MPYFLAHPVIFLLLMVIGYVHFCNSYPDPRLNGTSFINLSFAYAYCTSVYDSTSHCHVNKLIRYKNALSYCTTCYFSASYGDVHLYNSFPDPPLNWTIFSNLPDTSAYCTSVYSLNKLIRYKNALYYCTTCYFSAPHGYIHLYN